jgi:starch phosphorylase
LLSAATRSLTPQDVSVQILSGRVDASGEIKDSEITAMENSENEGNGCYRFQAPLRTARSGFFGYTIRVLPNHPDVVTPFNPLLITWASDTAVAALEPALK